MTVAWLSIERWLEQSQPPRIGDWCEEWAAFGLRELDAYRAKHAAFDDYLRRRGL